MIRTLASVAASVQHHAHAFDAWLRQKDLISMRSALPRSQPTGQSSSKPMIGSCLDVLRSCVCGSVGRGLSVAYIGDRNVNALASEFACDFRTDLARSARYLPWNRKFSIPARMSATVEVPTRRNENWYDFSLGLAGKEVFDWRYAGRIETGRAGISDPALSTDFSG